MLFEQTLEAGEDFGAVDLVGKSALQRDSSVYLSSHQAQNSPELSHLIPEILDWTQRSPLNTSLDKVLRAKKILAHCLGI